MQKIILVAVLSLFATGCASIFKGTDQTLSFSSEPSGAEVIIDGISQGKTPLSVKLKKNKYQSVTIKKTGFNTIMRPIEKNYDGVALLNIFWDCSTTDMITGAAYEYQPSSYHFTLETSDAESDSKGGEPAAKPTKKQ